MNAHEAHQVLVAAGIIEPTTTLEPLSGGVSCDVWRVASGVQGEYRAQAPEGLVIKAPLAQLRTPALWQVDISRGAAETEALRVMHTLTPASVPPVLWAQDDPPLLVVPFAPPGWQDWREQMLTAPADDPAVGARRLANIGEHLGRVLGTWHAGTVQIDDLPEVLRTGTRLRDLRTNPFHRATATEVPAWAGVLNALAEELEASRRCCVHGDFSPKNVLVAAGEDPDLWVLDAEVAHIGDPVFDLAYMATHLLLKGIHRADLSHRCAGTQEGFAAAYQRFGLPVDAQWWARNTGAIVAARVKGVSRVPYLDPPQAATALRVADGLLCADWSLARAWQEVLTVAAAGQVVG